MDIDQLTNLKQHPELFEQTIILIEKSLGYQKGESFKKDFYPLIEKENSHQNFIFRENGDVLGHAGVKVRYFGNSQLCMKDGPDWRGCGIGKTPTERNSYQVISKYI